MNNRTAATISTDQSLVQALSTAAAPSRVIRPARGWESLELGELWRYRELVLIFLWRNVKARYRHTMLGPLSIIIGPLVRMVIFTVILGKVAHLPSEGVPYHLFIYAALLPWTLFTTAVTGSTGSLVGYMPIISKIYFPRLIVPLAAALSGLVDFLVSFAILAVMALFYGFPITWRLLVLPYLMLVALTLGLAIGLFLAPVKVYYRDVSDFVTYILQFWFYATPVAYSAGVVDSRLAESYRWLYRFNPMNGVVEGFRWALVEAGRAPDWVLACGGLFALVLLFAGVVCFCRTTHSIVDIL